MLISHKHKFIFIKTGKVGGTSLEMALSRFMGPNDVITPLTWNDERERFRRGYPTAQNFAQPPSALGLRDWPRWLRSAAMSRVTGAEKALRARSRAPKRYWDHMPAASIRERIGDDIWNHYYKFSVERNPWDKMVSRYFWDPKKRKTDLSFRDFVLSGQGLRSNFEYYTLNGIQCVDRLIRYDRLYEELSEVSALLGLPEDVSETMRGLSAKGGYRKDRDVVGFYDDQTREIVEIFFAREIRLLGFEFGE